MSFGPKLERSHVRIERGPSVAFVKQEPIYGLLFSRPALNRSLPSFVKPGLVLLFEPGDLSAIETFAKNEGSENSGFVQLREGKRIDSGGILVELVLHVSDPVIFGPGRSVKDSKAFRFLNYRARVEGVLLHEQFGRVGV